MRPTKVFIPTSPHPQFKEILDFPPKGVKYISPAHKSGYHSKTRETQLRLHNKLTGILKVPRMMYVREECDLIHSTRGFLVANQKPWIVDCESAYVFTSHSPKALDSKVAQAIIKKFLGSKHCHKILPQSQAALHNLTSVLDCSKFEDKLEVSYLSIRPCEYKPKKREDDVFTISTIGAEFNSKGIQDLWEACKILSKKNDIRLRVKCPNIPEAYLRKKPDWVEVVKGSFSREELFQKMYLGADVFSLPSVTDTFGFVLLEAMSAGTPLVVTDWFTFPEIVEDGKNGFLVDSGYTLEDYSRLSWHTEVRKEMMSVHPKTVKGLVEKIQILINNPRLAKRMGQAGKKEVESPNGKFSVGQKRRQLERIYEEALRK